MLFAYIDETGDTGPVDKGGSSQCYALGCVLLEAEDWPKAFDQMLAFRRRLRDTYGVLLRNELKANYLIRGSSHLRSLNLSPDQRGLIYRAHLRMLTDINARAFSVVVDKGRARVSGADCFNMTWEMMLQRLERTTTYENKHAMIIHDDGENDQVRRLVRKARRHLTAGSLGGGGTIRVNAERLIEDPSPRSSQHSYMIQLADMVAYAGWRSYMPPSTGVARVVPTSMWDEIGSATHSAVNLYSGGTPGVVVRKS